MIDGELNLIRQAQEGDKEAYGQLYDRYIAQIYRFVVVKVTNKDEAQDLTHEVFLSAWQNLTNYKHQGFPFSSWLYQIARNKVIDHYRTKKDHADVYEIDEEFVKVASVVESNLDVRLAMDDIKKALTTLSDEQKDVIVMKFVEDLSNEEIAKAMNKSEGAIRLLQHRAINNLKELLWTDLNKS